MPVTFHPAPHKANPVKDVTDITAINLLETSCRGQWDSCDRILSSFIGSGDNATCSGLVPADKGLVSTISMAYNQHHALVLRPDDVWLAILVQFNLYVNAHAEELREQFVAHGDKQEIDVALSNIESLPIQMTEEMEKYIVDPDLREWILPNFSTTTSTDTVVAAVMMMATLKAYFSYSASIACGIPRVTLEGERGDWEQILYKAKKLREYGSEPAAWYRLLEPVLTRFVRAFDAPDAEENLDFWQRVADYRSGGSGPTYLSGWITAFCAFGSEGQWLGLPIDEGAPRAKIYWWQRDDEEEGYLTLDGVDYHPVNTAKVPPGSASVDITVNDDLHVYPAAMVAGLVASRVDDSKDTNLSDAGESDVISAVPGWWMFAKREGESRDQEEMRKMMEYINSRFG